MTLQMLKPKLQQNTIIIQATVGLLMIVLLSTATFGVYLHTQRQYHQFRSVHTQLQHLHTSLFRLESELFAFRGQGGHPNLDQAADRCENEVELLLTALQKATLQNLSGKETAMLTQHWRQQQEMAYQIVVLSDTQLREQALATFHHRQENLLRQLDSIDNNAQQQQQRAEKKMYALLAVLGVLLLGTILKTYHLLVVRFWKPVKQLQRAAQLVAAGNAPEANLSGCRGEIGRVAQALQRVSQGRTDLADFVDQLSQGQYTAPYEPLGESDRLGQSVVGLRNQLNQIALAEKHRLWANDGYARFADALHRNDLDLRLFADQLLSSLVKYLEVNQGAFFLYQNEDTDAFLERIATYAWERRKTVSQRIGVGEGLVGQAVREKDILYVNDVPADYISIRSGLGYSLPRAILVVPLIAGDEVQGVLELASLREIAPYKIDFVRKLSENIATTLATVKSHAQTQQLLAESRQLNHHLQSQEEVLRQNAMEMQAVQEKMQRKEAELTGLFCSIDHTLATLELDLEGTILRANANFCSLLGYSPDELTGRQHTLFFEDSYARSHGYHQFWQELRQGQARTQDERFVTRRKEEVWLNASYNPIQNASGQTYKIILLGQDITAKKRAELATQRLSLVADSTDNAVIITNKLGLIEYVNNGFTRISGYSAEEVMGKKPGSILQGRDTNPATIKNIREKLRNREPLYQEILNYRKDGRPYWISLAINPVFDEQGELEKFIAIQADITETKQNALDYNSQMQAISQANAIVEFDMQGHILQANKNFLRLVKADMESIRGKHHSIFVHPEDAASPEYQQLWETLRRGESVTGEFRRVDQLGQEIWVRGGYSAIFNLNGQPQKLIKFVQDVTLEKRQAQELAVQREILSQKAQELQAARDHLSERLDEALAGMRLQIQQVEEERQKHLAVLEGCVDGVISFDQLGLIAFFNSAAEQIWGVKRQDMLGKPIQSLLPIRLEVQHNAVAAFYRKNQQEKRIDVRTEMSVRQLNGEDMDILLTLTHALVGEKHTFTVFVQRVSVELF